MYYTYCVLCARTVRRVAIYFCFVQLIFIIIIHFVFFWYCIIFFLVWRQDVPFKHICVTSNQSLIKRTHMNKTSLGLSAHSKGLVFSYMFSIYMLLLSTITLCKICGFLLKWWYGIQSLFWHYCVTDTFTFYLLIYPYILNHVKKNIIGS